ncbi:C39 family peptidase [Streptomyces sp. CA-111067]|uniref:C39 family peptidase n=1 Tax=Streptomyces sp. CA-111067 TaxID=3240046 RepID=UPI003D9781EC
MTLTTITHPVPYYSQWESAALVPDFISGTRAATDPLWQKSGADSAEEYAFWAPRICGMACLRMTLDWLGHEVPPSVPLVREALDAGAYVRDGDEVKGLIYAPFAAWAAEQFGLYAQCRPDLPAGDVQAEVAAGRVVLLSVHKSIRTLEPAPPQRGGHLVLVVGAGPDSVVIHNPSGLPGRSQQFHHVPLADLSRFSAGRGVVLGPSTGKSST